MEYSSSFFLLLAVPCLLITSSSFYYYYYWNNACCKDNNDQKRIQIPYSLLQIPKQPDDTVGTHTTLNHHEQRHTNGTAYLMETIPLDTTLQPIPGTRDTWDVQMQYVQEAKYKIDFWAMYWTLLDDTDGSYTPEQKKQWGTNRGKLFYQELLNAAQRGVQIRIISELRLHDISELMNLQRQYPNQISYRLWNASEWYEFGMMHLKGWIFDDNRAMVTDANTDWRSFTQVKEVGIALEGSSPGFQPVHDLQLLFDRWWMWTDSTYKNSLQNLRMQVFDPYLQHTRLVPCFSMFGDRTSSTKNNNHNHDSITCQTPFNESSVTTYNFANPMPLILNNTLGQSFFTCSPPEICDTPNAIYSQYNPNNIPKGRTWDGDALVQTILTAHTQISISTMYFLPSAYTVFLNNPGWWPNLIDALLVKVSQGLNVRLLISQWTDAYLSMPGYFHALMSSAQANAMYAQHSGSIEIRYFALPGWQNATGLPGDDMYPNYSRVNHGKYIVTDNRFNLGTNEMEWSFFFNTAGTSFNSDHPVLRRQLQDVFDRDWNSEYAIPVPNTTAGLLKDHNNGDEYPLPSLMQR